MAGPREWSPRPTGRQGHIFSLENRGTKFFPVGIDRVLKRLTPDFVDSEGRKLYALDDVLGMAEDLKLEEFQEMFESYIRNLHEEDPELRGSIYVTF